jgi:hypothetical protein
MGDNSIFEPSYTITDFCKAENISQPTYFELRAVGLGPQEMRFPGKTLVRITHRDRLAWQDMLRNPTPEQAELIEKMRQRQRQKSHQREGTNRPRSKCWPAGRTSPTKLFSALTTR